MTSGDIMESGLATRVAGQACMEELFRLRAGVSPRPNLARFLGLSPLTPDEQPWYLGALGEREVGRLLASLDDGWTTLHAVAIGTGSSDVDHIVIGPGGVFTVNTKNHAGKSIWVASRGMMVAGQRVPYLRNAEFEAERATVKLSRILPPAVDVVPVIALVNPGPIKFKESPRTVRVMDARGLGRWLRKRPIVLAPHQVALISLVAADPSTWHTQPAPAGDTAELQAGFASLEREIRSARYVRSLWATIAVVGCLIAAFAFTSALI
ncbi:MAG: nuclease-related domain-containing protein [Terrimesophilobacter sp.]